MKELAIEARGLTKHFGDHLVVDGVSFSVPYGAVTAFIGGNGSGKTTVIRMILGLTLADRGESLVAGRPYARLEEPRRVVGAVVNRLGGHPGLSGRQHLRFIAAGDGYGADRIDSVLDEVGLADAAGRRVKGYSTGMQQRLAIAAALLHEPSILILDEPASGLDPAALEWLRRLVRTKAEAGVAVFMATHQLAEMSPVVDRTVALQSGRVVDHSVEQGQS